MITLICILGVLCLLPRIFTIADKAPTSFAYNIQGRTVRIYPDHWLARLLADKKGTLEDVSFDFAIRIDGERVVASPWLIAHSFKHVLQCERDGKWTFLRRWIFVPSARKAYENEAVSYAYANQKDLQFIRIADVVERHLAEKAK